MPGLELRSVSKRFGPLTAVEAVDLDLPAGKFISFLGPSGCGKTTLLRLIAGLETPSSGQVVLDDRDITALPTHRATVRLVTSKSGLLPCRRDPVRPGAKSIAVRSAAPSSGWSGVPATR